MKLLDHVALTVDLPQKGLRKGQVGTIVELLAPQIYEVEFSGLDGKAYALYVRLVHRLAPRRCWQRIVPLRLTRGPRTREELVKP